MQNTVYLLATTAANSFDFYEFKLYRAMCAGSAVIKYGIQDHKEYFDNKAT